MQPECNHAGPACAPMNEQLDPALAGHLAASRSRFVEALIRRDAVRAADAYTADARLLAPSAELLTGRSAIERFWQAGIEAGLTEIELRSLEIWRVGADAYEIGSYELRLETLDGSRVIDRGRYLFVLRQEGDGVWRRAVEMFSPDRSPQVEQPGLQLGVASPGLSPGLASTGS
jgi:ketosteroid isomerase-like protein